MSKRRSGRRISKAYQKVIAAAAVAALALIVFCFYNLYQQPSALQNVNTTASGALEVQFIDVGQADSSLIKLPNGKTMLIDAGGNSTADRLVRYIKGQGISKIDYLVGTHPHEDHIGGMDKVIDNFDIGEIYLPKVDDSQVPTTRSYTDLLSSIAKKDKKVTQGKAGVSVFNDGELSAQVIAPNSDKYDELNSYSIVIKLTYKSNSFLFMGDAEKDSENEIMKKYDIKADVIKCGHHGSSSSSGKEFIAAVKPQYAVISCGVNNDYGHPHAVTLNTLSKNNVELYRTDNQNTITAISDGTKITFSTQGTSCVK